MGTTIESSWENERLKEQLAAAQARIKQLESAIDEEMVITNLGVFNPGDDPVKAIKGLMIWSQDVGEYFANDQTQAREAELVAHVARLRDALQIPCDRWNKHQHKIVKEALESTPAQSLVRLRNEVLEEAAKKMDLLLQEWAGTSSANDDYRHAYKCAGQSIRAMKEPE